MEKNNTTQPTDSQIRTLMSDWLGNLRLKDEGNYTHKGRGGIHTSREGGFVDYLVGDIDRISELEAIKKGREAAKRVVESVARRPMEVNVGGNASFHQRGTNLDRINLATDFFDDRGLSNREKVDILLGLASHESAHSVYTDYGGSEKHLEGLKDDIAGLKHQVWNILEDERIEYLLGEDRPGLADCIGATKRHYFDRLVKQMRTDGKAPTERVPRLLAALTQAVRYPSEMRREDVVDNFDQLESIRRALTPFPLSPEGCWQATERIMDIIRDEVKKEMEEERQQQQQQQDQAGGPGTPGDQPQQAPSGERQPSDAQGGGPGQQGNGPAPTKQEIEKALSKALATKEARQVLTAIQKDGDKSDSGNTAGCLMDSDNSRFANEDDAECIGAGSGDPDFFVFKPKGDAEAYGRCKRSVNALVPAMSHALACKSQQKEYVLRGMPSGKLNTNKLASLRTGNKSIFDKSGAVRCSAASVCLLIDESGSMGGEKQMRAREAAILINEAIARISNVRFFCYGYTSDRLNVYSEMGRTSRFALSATEARGGTPTGKAMKLCADRVRRFGNDRCLMLVMTDGHADNSTLVIQQDKTLHKKGFVPIGIGILSSAVEKTFQEYVVLRNIARLPLDLGKLTKKYLSKMLVTSEE